MNLWHSDKRFDELAENPTSEAIYNLYEDCICMREEIERQQAEIERLKAKCDAWKEAAEYQYGRYRAARYGESDSDYPVKGALDAWALNKYEVLKRE